MNIEFILSQTDGRPIYQQIMEEVVRRVSLKDWPPGTRMPSIRELAVALKVSVITVKRAYLELERMGVIVTQQGRGSWISEGLQVTNLQRKELQRQIDQLLQLAATMGLCTDELIYQIEQHTNKKSGGENK